MRVAVLTVSTTRAPVDDTSGDALDRLAREAGHEVVERAIVTDDARRVTAELTRLAASADLVLTTGGTGLTPDDVTPEATRAAIDREIPGIAEALRADSLRHTAMAMLSRGIAGTLGSTLIVNFPGSTRACEQCFPVIEPVLDHARAQLTRQP